MTKQFLYRDCLYWSLQSRKGVKNDLLISRRGYFNELRNVAIYLIKRLRSATLKGAGEAFGISKNSTVGSVVERVKREMTKNKRTRKNVQNLMVILTKSQE